MCQVKFAENGDGGIIGRELREFELRQLPVNGPPEAAYTVESLNQSAINGKLSHHCH